MDGVTSYHTEGSVVARTAQGEVRVVVSSDVERPDRVRSTTDVSGLVVQSISVAGRTWVKDAVGPWRDLKPGSKDAAAGDPFALLRGLDDARVAGSETVGGTEAWLIETSASAGAVVRAFPAGGAPAPSGTAKVSVWIAKSGSRVLRILATTPGGGFTVDVSFSKFGEKFGIVPPKG